MDVSNGTAAPDSDIHFLFVFRLGSLKYLAWIPDEHVEHLHMQAHLQPLRSPQASAGARNIWKWAVFPVG